MKIEIEVGPEVAKLVERLRESFTPELFAHQMRSAVAEQALQFSVRLEVTHAEKLAVNEELYQQLQGTR